ncbi:putative isoflavone reductase like protein IRL, partial [Bisporella sp. PMI_857]
MAATLIRNVVVIGAGGSLGPAVLKAFDSHFVVTIISRQSSTSTFAAKYKVRIVEDDYPTAQLLEAFKNQDAVISLISPGTSQTQYHIIDAAVEAGVKRFIPADFGYDIANANAIALLPALQIRVDIINYLKAQEEKDMTWTNITTGPFFDWGLTNGFTGFDIPNRKAMIYDNGDQPFSTSTVMLI